MSSIDVVVPCYRYGHYLRTSVESILAQQGVDLRVLIIDDASPDETEQVGRALARQDRRVEFRRHATNQGHIPTYNEGLEWSRAEYSLILSADDVLTPGSLWRATSLMDAHPNLALAYGRDVTFHTPQPPPPPPDGPCECDVLSYRQFLDLSCSLGITPVQSPTAIARLSTHRKVGGYRVDQPHSGDTELWLRLAAHGGVGRVHADQAFRRLHAANMSSGYSLVRRLEEHRKAFETHFSEFGALIDDVDGCRRRVQAAWAQQAFWVGSRALESGDLAACDECVAYAVALDPSIRSSRAWSRLQLKRRLGPRVLNFMRPLVSLRAGRKA